MRRDAIAVIPARGGSQRIPRKNIRPISGRPLIEWTIEMAGASGIFSEVVVSTDDEEIAQIATAAGALVPFVRPAELASDTASTQAVMSHAVTALKDQGFRNSDVCCIYPGAIFVSGEDLAAARELLGESSGDDHYVMSVVAYPHPIQRALRIDSQDFITPINSDVVQSRTQDLEPRWHDAGQFYWGKADAWQKMEPVLASAKAYVLSSSSVVDIDTEDDWLLAERLHAAYLHMRQSR